MRREYLSLSKDVRAQLVAFLQNVLSLLGRNVYLQGRGHGRVDETADDCGDFLLDGGIITVGMTEVLHSKAKREKEEWKVTWEQFCVPTVPQMFAIIEEFLYRDRKTRASFFFCSIFKLHIKHFLHYFWLAFRVGLTNHRYWLRCTVTQ